MVAVPGLNDSEDEIRTLVNIVQPRAIEVLQYHSMYEEKADKLGLDVPRLRITAEQSRASLERVIELFSQHGVKAFSTELETPGEASNAHGVSACNFISRFSRIGFAAG